MLVPSISLTVPDVAPPPAPAVPAAAPNAARPAEAAAAGGGREVTEVPAVPTLPFSTITAAVEAAAAVSHDHAAVEGAAGDEEAGKEQGDGAEPAANGSHGERLVVPIVDGTS